MLFENRAGEGGHASLVSQERPDPLDGFQVVALAERPDGAAVGERLVDGKVEAVLALLHLRAVQRAGPAFGAQPPACGALPGVPVAAVLEEEQLDPTVRGGLERLRPPGGGAPVAAGLFAPALDGRGLLLPAPLREYRLDRLKELRRAGVGLGARPADDRLLDLVRDGLFELRPGLLRAHDHEPRAPKPPGPAVDVLREVPQVVVHQLLAVAPVAGLRPAALVVAPGLLVELLDELLELPGAQTVELAALAADDRDQRPLAAADERHERREVERVTDPHEIRHALAQRQRVPDVVGPGAEDGETVRALAAELVLEELAHPRSVVPNSLLLLVGELGAVRRLG